LPSVWRSIPLSRAKRKAPAFPSPGL